MGKNILAIIMADTMCSVLGTARKTHERFAQVQDQDQGEWARRTALL